MKRMKPPTSPGNRAQRRNDIKLRKLTLRRLAPRILDNIRGRDGGCSQVRETVGGNKCIEAGDDW